MSRRYTQAQLDAALQSFVTQSLLPRFEPLRQRHSHSDRLLPPDLVLETLVPLVLAWKAEVQLDTSLTPPQALGQEAAADEGVRVAWEEENARIQKHNKAIIYCNEALDEGTKDLVTERIARWASVPQIQDDELKSLYDRLDVSIALEHANVGGSTTPLTILESVLDTVSISSCASIMDWIESRKSALTTNMGTSAVRGKYVIFLRMGNQLNRRLSKPSMEDTILAGRLASFLSSVFPLGERSGVNLKGEYNVENKTSFDTEFYGEAKSELEAKDDSEVETGMEPDEDAEKQKVVDDARFYTLFWSIQQFFANPALLFEADSVLPPELLPRTASKDASDGAKSKDESKDDDKSYAGLEEFKLATGVVLEKLFSVDESESKLTGNSGAVSREAAPKEVTMDTQTDGAEKHADEAFYPKYLTGRNLLASELRDPTFRRQILVQFLILVQYILESGHKRRATWIGTKNKHFHRPWELDSSSLEWCNKTWKNVLQHLSKMTGPRSCAVSTTQALRREHSWSGWKADQCPDLHAPLLSASESQIFADSMRRLGSRLPLYPHALGSAALGKLWSDGVPPPRLGKRRRENGKGIEVEVGTDGLEELEFGPMANEFDVYAHKWRKVEARLDGRREQLQLPKGRVRREQDLWNKARVVATSTHLNEMIAAKSKLQTLAFKCEQLEKEVEQLTKGLDQTEQQNCALVEKVKQELQTQPNNTTVKVQSEPPDDSKGTEEEKGIRENGTSADQSTDAAQDSIKAKAQSTEEPASEPELEKQRQEPEAKESTRQAKVAELSALKAEHAALQAQAPTGVQRQKQVGKTAAAELAQSEAAQVKERNDGKIAESLEEEYSLSWRALRLGALSQLRLIGQVPLDDLGLLQKAIDGSWDPKSIVIEPVKEDTPMADAPIVAAPAATVTSSSGAATPALDGSNDAFAAPAMAPKSAPVSVKGALSELEVDADVDAEMKEP